MENQDVQLMLCINNGGSEDLEVRKLYEVIPDDNASRDHYLRVIDESGEDYLYPEDYFLPVELSSTVRNTILQAA
jgi:hypothetical protein